MYKSNHKKWIDVAIRAAKSMHGKTGVNPNVGAVLVCDDEMISIGTTGEFGSPHAEISCLGKVKNIPENAILYITLEPCCHIGKNPPCVQKIIESGVRNIIVGVRDSNPIVNGNGIKELEGRGIKVTVLEDKDCVELHREFIHRHQTNFPYVTIKLATSLNGYISAKSLKWLSNKKTKRYTDFQRHYYDAIMIGSTTLFEDNPTLNCRIKGLEKFSPIRVILISSEESAQKLSKTYDDLNLFKCKDSKILITTEHGNILKNLESELVKIEHGNSKDLKEVLHMLAKKYSVNNLLVEGGAKLTSSFLNEGLFQKFVHVITPNIIQDGFNMFDKEILQMQKMKLILKDVKQIEDNVILTFTSNETNS